MSPKRAYLYGLLTMALLVSLGGAGVVSADGGQTDLIHACILAEGGANLRIVGPNDTCDPGTTPLHWSGESFEPDEVIPPPPAPDDPSKGSAKPSRKVKERFYATLGIKSGKLKTVTKSIGPKRTQWQSVTVSCPASHPFALSTKSSWVIHDPEGKIDPWSEKIFDVGWHAKTVYLRAYKIFSESGLPAIQVTVNWTLTAKLTCAKFATPKGGSVGAA